MTINHIITLCAQINEHELNCEESFSSTSVEVLNDVYNGCGPDWMPLQFRSVLTELLDEYEPAFLVHDWDYTFLRKNEASFHRANKRLFHNCMKLMKSRISWYRFIRRWHERAKILAIYHACEIYGEAGFMVAK
jgi:hypothetical protein